MTSQEKTNAINEMLGYMGRMISGSKVAPKGQRVFWNGNIFDSSANKIWYGDINFTRDAGKLQKIASALNEKIYVTTESPYRFMGAFGNTENITAEKLENDALEKDYPRVIIFTP